MFLQGAAWTFEGPFSPVFLGGGSMSGRGCMADINSSHLTLECVEGLRQPSWPRAHAKHRRTSEGKGLQALKGRGAERAECRLLP